MTETAAPGADAGPVRSPIRVELPPVGSMLSLWLGDEVRTAEYTRILRRAEIRRCARTPDGEPLSREQAAAIAGQPAALRDYRAARDAQLAAATQAGCVYAECPHCRGWDAALAPLALAVALRTPFWPITAPSGDLALPALSYPSMGRGLPLVAASRLTVELPRTPGRRLPLDASGAPGRLHGWAAASQRLFQTPGTTADWTPDSPGWTAMLRLASLIPNPPASDPPTVDQLLAWTGVPLSDVLYLDNVYYLTHLAELPGDGLPVLDCPRCDGRFLPLATAPEWP